MSGDGSSGREEQCIVNNQTQKLISLFFKKLLHFNFPFITKKRRKKMGKYHAKIDATIHDGPNVFHHKKSQDKETCIPKKARKNKLMSIDITRFNKLV